MAGAGAQPALSLNDIMAEDSEDDEMDALLAEATAAQPAPAPAAVQPALRDVTGASAREAQPVRRESAGRPRPGPAPAPASVSATTSTAAGPTAMPAPSGQRSAATPVTTASTGTSVSSRAALSSSEARLGGSMASLASVAA